MPIWSTRRARWGSPCGQLNEGYVRRPGQSASGTTDKDSGRSRQRVGVAASRPNFGRSRSCGNRLKADIPADTSHGPGLGQSLRTHATCRTAALIRSRPSPLARPCSRLRRCFSHDRGSDRDRSRSVATPPRCLARPSAGNGRKPRSTACSAHACCLSGNQTVAHGACNRETAGRLRQGVRASLAQAPSVANQLPLCVTDVPAINCSQIDGSLELHLSGFDYLFCHCDLAAAEQLTPCPQPLVDQQGGSWSDFIAEEKDGLSSSICLPAIDSQSPWQPST